MHTIGGSLSRKLTLAVPAFRLPGEVKLEPFLAANLAQTRSLPAMNPADPSSLAMSPGILGPLDMLFERPGFATFISQSQAVTPSTMSVRRDIRFPRVLISGALENVA
ncbi:hypothetical protein A0H81_01973 [Grifola frondosa]|uniref:Uncharacterized protein n=1 Tax=Grifola frondosa TaxID=5627 RepID=A0A1C7MKX2_GRIFR|nr:hypothetical protein A0H81_01973 [Grifola frondosa]